MKYIRNLFKLKKENEATKDRIIRGIGSFLEQEDDYYKPISVGKFLNNNYIEYESNRDKIKTVNEYKIKPYLKAITIDLQKSCTWKM